MSNPVVDKYNKRMNMIKSDPIKSKALQFMMKTKAYFNPGDIMSYVEFGSLPTEYFSTLCWFDERDWLSYGAMTEYEYFDNRDDEDKVSDKELERLGKLYVNPEFITLTEKQFNKVKVNNPSPRLTYKMYLAMRNIEYPRKKPVICSCCK
jgi:hypothetical protein